MLDPGGVRLCGPLLLRERDTAPVVGALNQAVARLRGEVAPYGAKVRPGGLAATYRGTCDDLAQGRAAAARTALDLVGGRDAAPGWPA